MQEIVTRQTALRLRLARYFTGKPCKRGHVAERYVPNGLCVTCQIAMSAAWAKANPGRTREIARKWKAAHPARVREEKRSYHRAHPETSRRANHARRARKRNAVGVVTRHIEDTLLWAQDGKCDPKYGCGQPFTEAGGHHLDHRVPLSKGGLHDDENLQLLCHACNRAKGAMMPGEWLRHKRYNERVNAIQSGV